MTKEQAALILAKVVLISIVIYWASLIAVCIKLGKHRKRINWVIQNQLGIFLWSFSTFIGLSIMFFEIENRFFNTWTGMYIVLVSLLSLAIHRTAVLIAKYIDWRSLKG